MSKSLRKKRPFQFVSFLPFSPLLDATHSWCRCCLPGDAAFNCFLIKLINWSRNICLLLWSIPLLLLTGTRQRSQKIDSKAAKGPICKYVYNLICNHYALPLLVPFYSDHFSSREPSSSSSFPPFPPFLPLSTQY